MPFCTKCGKEYFKSDDFCNSCGTNLNLNQTNQKDFHLTEELESSIINVDFVGYRGDFALRIENNHLKIKNLKRIYDIGFNEIKKIKFKDPNKYKGLGDGYITVYTFKYGFIPIKVFLRYPNEMLSTMFFNTFQKKSLRLKSNI